MAFGGLREHLQFSDNRPSNPVPQLNPELVSYHRHTLRRGPVEFSVHLIPLRAGLEAEYLKEREGEKLPPRGCALWFFQGRHSLGKCFANAGHDFG